ncbi:MAG: metallophosphoesterase [archaeon]
MKILVLGDFQGVFPGKLRKKLEKEEFDIIVGVGDYSGIDDFRPWLKKMFKMSHAGKGYLSAVEYFGEKGLERVMKKDENAGKNVLSELNGLGKKVICVFGNFDDYWYLYPFQKTTNVPKRNLRFVKKLKNLNNITYGYMRQKGINFVGFGGYMDVSANWKNTRSKEEMERAKKMLVRVNKTKRLLSRLMKKGKPEILVLHYPPKGVFDIIHDKSNPYNGKSAGIDMFRQAVLKYKPRLVLCGHMHEYQGAKRLGKSLVVNPGDAEKGKYAIVDFTYEKIDVRFVE